MLKNIIVAFGIAALTSSAAFAAAPAPKTETPTHKVAQADEAKPAEAKKAKKGKKAKKEPKATEPAAEPAK
jgi:hypothetical protein